MKSLACTDVLFCSVMTSSWPCIGVGTDGRYLVQTDYRNWKSVASMVAAFWKVMTSVLAPPL